MEVEMPTIETIRKLVQNNVGVAFSAADVRGAGNHQGKLCEVRVKEMHVERKIRLVYPPGGVEPCGEGVPGGGGVGQPLTVIRQQADWRTTACPNPARQALSSAPNSETFAVTSLNFAPHNLPCNQQVVSPNGLPSASKAARTAPATLGLLLRRAAWRPGRRRTPRAAAGWPPGANLGDTIPEFKSNNRGHEGRSAARQWLF